jgi:glycosyltransferase involved in cell wall biosynthesis
VPDEVLPPDEYILYTGFDFNPGEVFSSKDGLLTLISAFADLASNQTALKLIIIGENNQLYHNLAAELGVSEMVVFLGRRSRKEIIAYQKNAKLLVLPRPWSKQAEGGFSSKLGEYLLTGKPVLMTDVGDAGRYLTHGINAFFAIPGDRDDLSGKMKWLLGNYDEALKVGAAGREVALTRFNHKIEGEKLVKFLEDYLDSRST